MVKKRPPSLTQKLLTLLDQGQLEQAMELVRQTPVKAGQQPSVVARMVGLLHAYYCDMSISIEHILDHCQCSTKQNRRRTLTYALHFGQKDLRSFPVPVRFMQAFFASWDLPMPVQTSADLDVLVNQAAKVLLQDPASTDRIPERSQIWCALEEAAPTVLLSLLYQDVSQLAWVASQMILHSSSPQSPNALVLAWFLVVCNSSTGLEVKRDLVRKWMPYLCASTTHRSQILTLVGYTQQYLIGPRHEANEILAEAVLCIHPQTDVLWKVVAPMYLQSLHIHEGFPLTEVQRDCELLLQEPANKLYHQASLRIDFMLEVVRALTETGNAQLENSRYSFESHLSTMRGEITSSSRVHILPTAALLAWSLDNPSMVLRHLIGLEQLSYRIALCFLHPDHLVILCWALLKQNGAQCLQGESEHAQIYKRARSQLNEYCCLNEDLFGARSVYVQALELQAQNHGAQALAVLQGVLSTSRLPQNPILRYHLFHLGIHLAIAESDLPTAKQYYQSALLALRQWQAKVLQARLRHEHGWLWNETGNTQTDAPFQLAVHRLVLDLVTHSREPQQLGKSLAQALEASLGATESWWIHAETLQSSTRLVQDKYPQEPALENWLVRSAQTRQIVSNTAGSPLSFIAIPYGTATACNLVVLINRFHAQQFTHMQDWLEDLVPLVTQATALSEANTHLHRLSFQNVQSHEATRKRIAQDLHDNLGQDIALLQLKLGVLLHQWDTQNNQHAPLQLKEAQSLVQTMGEKVRRIAHDLRPRDLDDGGLLVSVQGLFVASFPAPMALNFQFATPEPEIPIDAKIQLFRCLQEACKNILQHAHASHVQIQTQNDGRFFTLIVQDNGVGLPLSFFSRPWLLGGTFGLMGMDERMRSVQGRFKISSPQGGGTHLQFQIPLRQEERSHANLDI